MFKHMDGIRSGEMFKNLDKIVAFTEHPNLLSKNGKLNPRLIAWEVAVVGMMQNLKAWAKTKHPNGILQGVTSKDIARVVGWLGDPDKLIDALVESEIIRKDGEGQLTFSDWYSW